MAETRNPIKCAETGDLEFFQTVDVEVLRNTKSDDDHGDSVLSRAMGAGHVECCEEILKRCPELLYQKSNHGFTGLLWAARNGSTDCVRLFLHCISKTETQGIENRRDGSLLTAATSYKKKTALHMAVQKGFFECAKLLLEADPSNMLLKMAMQETGDTAMHIAVAKHDLEIVKLLSQSDSTSSYTTNNSGHTPLWIAFQESLAGDPRAVEIRKLLIEKFPDESNMRTGANNWTMLHQAARKGDIGTVEDIFRFCPFSFDLVDNEGQTFLHHAAKFRHVDIIKYTIGIKELPGGGGILNGQDNYGNTALHIAALGGQPDVALPLLYDARINKMLTNKQGKTALDMINFDFDRRRARVYGLTNKLGEKEIKDQSDFDLVVGALIAAVSFTAGITVPGGYIADGHNKGTAILANTLSFKVFAVANTFALLLSLYAVFCHFCAKRLVRQEHVIHQLHVATYCSLGAIFAMVVAFIAGSYAVLAVTGGFAIFVCVLCCFFFLFASRAMWRMISQNRAKYHLD